MSTDRPMLKIENADCTIFALAGLRGEGKLKGEKWVREGLNVVILRYVGTIG